MRIRAYAADMNLAQRSLDLDNLGRARQLLDRYRPMDGEEDLRGWEWRYLWGNTRDRSLASLHDSAESIADLAASPVDGQWIAVARWENGITLINRWSRKEEPLPGAKKEDYNNVAFSADGEWLAYGALNQPNLPYGEGWKVHVINMHTREETGQGDLPGICMGIEFIDQGRTLLTCATTEAEAAIVESAERMANWVSDIPASGAYARLSP